MYTYKICLLKVVDGDTIDAEIDLGFDIRVKKRVRFMGINAPESRTKDLEEKARGLAAKNRVKALLEGELHLDVVDGQEKLTLVSLNELLINEGHATKYDGGKR